MDNPKEVIISLNTMSIFESPDRQTPPLPSFVKITTNKLPLPVLFWKVSSLINSQGNAHAISKTLNSRFVGLQFSMHYAHRAEKQKSKTHWDLMHLQIWFQVQPRMAKLSIFIFHTRTFLPP